MLFLGLFICSSNESGGNWNRKKERNSIKKFTSTKRNRVENSKIFILVLLRW